MEDFKDLLYSISTFIFVAESVVKYAPKVVKFVIDGVDKIWKVIKQKSPKNQGKSRRPFKRNF